MTNETCCTRLYDYPVSYFHDSLVTPLLKYML